MEDIRSPLVTLLAVFVCGGVTGMSPESTAMAIVPILIESPQMRVGSGGASSMPPQQRNSIEINAPGEWKP